MNVDSRSDHLQMLPNLCVIIPAHNAAKTIDAVVRGALTHVPTVIVADDGSTDATGAVAAAAGATVLIVTPHNGKGHALKTLFHTAINGGYETAISMDADGQHDPEELPRLLEEHAKYPDCIVVGTRMRERGKIPRARYHSMQIARFYISLAANQFIEDTQCGYRVYPLSIVNALTLVTEQYVTETELLMKAGDMGKRIRFVSVRTIYGDQGSHFRPIIDVTRIATYVVSYLLVKWFIEGLVPNRPNTYASKGHFRDRISANRTVDMLFQWLTVFIALPATVLFLLEYLTLQPFIPGTFASIRTRGFGFARVTLATQMLPVVLVVAMIEKAAGTAGLECHLLDGLIARFYPPLWSRDLPHDERGVVAPERE